MRRVVKFAFLFIALFAVAKFCHQQTDGFAVVKMSTTLLPYSSEMKTDTFPDQKYTYLTKGGQSYVFLSEDGKTVLKLFRSSKLSTLSLVHNVFSLGSITRKMEKLKMDERETLKSYNVWKRERLMNKP